MLFFLRSILILSFHPWPGRTRGSSLLDFAITLSMHSCTPHACYMSFPFTQPFHCIREKYPSHRGYEKPQVQYLHILCGHRYCKDFLSYEGLYLQCYMFHSTQWNNYCRQLVSTSVLICTDLWVLFPYGERDVTLLLSQVPQAAAA
jgi:hypothetical protein